MNRRRFLGMNLGVGAALVTWNDLNAAALDPTDSRQHQQSGMQLRAEAAASQLKSRPSAQVTTGDEERYADKRASFSKTLPHDELGEVLPEAYRLFVNILVQREPKRFAEMPRAANAQLRLNNPQAGYAYDLAGIDSNSTALAMPPPFAGPRMASEMAELYWLALTRDVPYREYESDGLIAKTLTDLDAFSGPAGPSVGGKLTPQLQGESRASP